MIIGAKHIYKQLSVFVLMLACALTGHAQLLQKTTKAGRPSMMFSSVIAEENSFVIIGVTTNPTPPYYTRSLIGRMDSQGDFTSITYFNDSISKNYGTFFNCLDNINGNYWYTGYTEDSIPRVLLVKVDQNLSVELHEYGSLDHFAYKGHHILEVNNFTYIAGVITVSGKPDMVLIKINEDKSIAWQRTYGVSTYGEVASSFVQLQNGNLMIGGFRNNAVLGNEKANTWLLEVDTAGEIVRQWFDPNDSTYGAYGLRQTTDEGFYYALQKKYEQTVTDVRPVGAIVRMDNQFNKLWQYEGDRDSPYTGLFDIEQLADGSFIACGSRHVYGNIPSIVSAWVVKVSSTGQEIWSREYSGSTALNTRNFLNDIDVLPNGNLVAVGETSNGSEGQFGLLLVLDSNGCVIENCTVGIEDLEPKAQVNVYPNPFTHKVTVSIQNALLSDATITVTNPLGQELYQVRNISLSGSYTLDLYALPGGLYFISLETNGERMVKQVVKQ